jgi:hypothetical protein
VNLRIRRCAIAATLSLMACSGSSIGASDTYYRWNDASGNPVNSDRPPPVGVEYDVITTNTIVPAEVEDDIGAQSANPDPTMHFRGSKNP